MPFHLRPATEADIPALARVMTAAFRGGAISTTLFPPRLARYEGDPPVLVDEETPWRTMRFGMRMRKPDSVVMVVVEDGVDPSRQVAEGEKAMDSAGGAKAGGMDASDGRETGAPSQGRIVGLGQWTKPSPRMEAEVAADVKDAMESEAAAEAAAAAPGDGQGTKAKDEEPPPQSLDVEALEGLVATIKEANERVFGPDHMKEMWYVNILTVDPDYQRRGIGRMLLDWGLEQAAKEKRDSFLEATKAGKPLYLRAGFEEIAELTICGETHWQMVKKAS